MKINFWLSFGTENSDNKTCSCSVVGKRMSRVKGPRWYVRL